MPMIIQSNLSTLRTISVSLRLSATVTCQPACITSLDYGFDFDEEELARELSTPLPEGLGDKPAPLVEAEEFERLYHWFCS